jgi:cell division protein FtsB
MGMSFIARLKRLIEIHGLFQMKSNLTPSAIRLLDMHRLCSEAARAQRVLEEAAAELALTGTGQSLSKAVAVAHAREKEMEEISSQEKQVRAEIGHLRDAIKAANERAVDEQARESLAVAKLRDGLLETRYMDLSNITTSGAALKVHASFRRFTKGEEEYVRAVQAVKERERGEHLEDEEQNMQQWRDEWVKEINLQICTYASLLMYYHACPIF